MPKYQDTGRCIGYAHVLFTDEAGYDAALALNGQKLGSRYLEINMQNYIFNLKINNILQRTLRVYKNQFQQSFAIFSKKWEIVIDGA